MCGRLEKLLEQTYELLVPNISPFCDELLVKRARKATEDAIRKVTHPDLSVDTFIKTYEKHTACR